MRSKTLKKGMVLILAASLIFSMTACANDKASVSSASVSEEIEASVSTEEQTEASVEVLSDEAKDETSAEDVKESEETSAEDKEEETEEMLDDLSYIAKMEHTTEGAWQQYDVMLDAGGYGWNYMVDTAAYLEANELDDISQLSVALISGADAQDLVEDYKNSGAANLKEYEKLSEENEMGLLSIGGISRTVNAPVMVVWYNQTNFLRVYTIIDDDTMMTKYIETLIRRTFGTEDAMKLAKPVPQE